MGVHKRPRVFTRLKKRPYTRISKRDPDKNFIKAAPDVYTRQFEEGNKKGNFDVEVYIVPRSDCQIRDRALESIRVLAKQRLEKELSSTNYYMKIWVYPHHVLREHKTPSVASKAERISKGMRRAFGRPIGRAARVRKGQKVLSVFTHEKNIDIVKTIMKKITPRLPSSWEIKINYLKAQ